MRAHVLAGFLSFLLMAFGCFGQAYTYQDEAFMRLFLGITGTPGIPSCGNYTAHLLHYWKIDEGSGTFITDYVSGSSIGGSLLNGVLWVNDGPVVTPGLRMNYSVQCPTWNSWVNGGNDANNYIITNNYTVSLWAYHLNVTPISRESMIGGFDSHGNFHFGIGIYYNQTQYGWGDITLGDYQPGPTVASVGANWTFWVMTRIGNTWTLWKDDPASGPAVTPITSSSQGSQGEPCTIWIGNSPRGDGFSPRNWQGYIADVRIYKNYGLSSNEVWCLYHQYYGRN